MPNVLIEVKKSYSPKEKTALIEAVFSALEEAFNVTAKSKNIRLLTHEADCFVGPIDNQHPELYTHISIDCFPGRSLDMKRGLYQSLVQKLALLGIPKDHVEILIREMNTENWGIRGGQAACDL